jgi:predicted amidophosphoribosyltransferase
VLAKLPEVVAHEHEQQPDPEEFEEGCCPSCGEELVDEEATQLVCWCCAERLERELAAYLEFVAVSREPA